MNFYTLHWTEQLSSITCILILKFSAFSPKAVEMLMEQLSLENTALLLCELILRNPFVKS